MVARLQDRTISVFNLFSAPPVRPQPDEYYYEDQEQLAAALSALLPDGLAPQPLPEVGPDEFEKLYGWFLS